MNGMPYQDESAGEPADRSDEEFPAAALEGSVWNRFETIARRYPDRPAIRDGSRGYTYGELHREAVSLAALVEGLPASAGPLAILMGNEARYCAALLGAWRVGRTCLLLDGSHPVERNRKIVTQAGAHQLLTTAARRVEAAELAPGADLRDIDVARPEGNDVVAREVSADAIACIIYTSGTTANPKGVFQNHRGVLHDIRQSVSTTGVTPEDRIAQFYSPAVIAGFRTLFSGILSGAAMEILPPLEHGAAGLAAEIRIRRITLLRLSPTLFRHIAGALGDTERFADVRMVALGGDRVDWSEYDLCRRICPAEATFFVQLGATECWTVYAQWCVDGRLRSAGPLPVGEALPEREVSLQDVHGNAVADGEVGEMVVTSRYVALGYWRDPELTRHSFGTAAHDAASRVYRTGDLGRRRADGLIDYIGRQDQQIKLHGYRIEPDEVEAALKACEGVRDGVVLLQRDPAGSPVALVGYAARQPSATHLLSRHVLAMLNQRLPSHMMPARVVLIDELPLLPNFKVDRQRLLFLDAAALAAGREQSHEALIQSLIEIFEDITQTSGATAEDSISSLGGDSLQALEAVREMADCCQVALVESAYASSRSIDDWAREIAARRTLDPPGAEV